MYQGSEYASKSKYAGLLNIPFAKYKKKRKYKKVPFPENWKRSFETIQEIFSEQVFLRENVEHFF